MSASSGEQPPPKRAPRAAELAAQQVEKIVSVAQESAEKMTAAAREEAASVRALARESAQADVEAARKEATARIREAQQAADDVLAETKAVSGGMRQLANLLTVHAERILRDVQNSHRSISADLRAASRGEQAPAAAEPAADDEPAPAAPRRPRRPGADGGDNPFADLEPPSWVENA
jgi:predicted neutral ceramidase superfamily lipid hydrolase